MVELDPLELSSGTVFGPRRTPLPESAPDEGATPRQILDELLVSALSEPPCHVLFSGGRDSSVILAAAVRVARAHGLEPPVPLTATYAGHPHAQESDWQTLVMRHLGLSEQVSFEAGGEQDALGEVATQALHRHGMFWPPNAFSIVGFARQAQSGTCLTGGGGDELFSPWYWGQPPLRELLRLRPRRRVLKWTAYYQLPLRLQQRVRHYDEVHLRWLRPEAERELNAAMKAGTPREPSYFAELEAYIRSRYLECLLTTVETLAAGEGVRFVEPFYDARMIRAVGRTSPQWGYPSRTAMLEHFFADLLPSEVLRRATKAYFTSAAWGPAARAFAAAWDGDDVDERLVDRSRLKAEWATEIPDARSLALLHSTWLASARASGTGGQLE